MIWEGASKEIGNDDGIMYLFNLRQYSSYTSQQFLQIHVVIVARLPVTFIRQKMGGCNCLGSSSFELLLQHHREIVVNKSPLRIIQTKGNIKHIKR